MLTIRCIVVFVLFLIANARSDTLSDGQDTKTFVEEHIAAADVMVFAKSYCPHCRRTKALLDELHNEMEKGWVLDVVDLDLMPADDGPKIQAQLFELTGQRTVPNIFIGGTPIGGNSDLQALHYQEQELTPMLQGLADAHGEDL